LKEILEDVIVEIKTNFYFQIYNGIPHTSQALLILLFSYTYRLGADINIKNDRGETPYDLATRSVKESQHSLCRFIRSYNSSISVINNSDTLLINL
jgi:hypothetical protein